MTPDPAAHVHIAQQEAAIAARKWREDPAEWLGLCYLWLTEAAERYRPDGGASFPVYASKYIKWRVVDERYSRNLGRQTNSKVKRRGPIEKPVDEEVWTRRRDASAPCPVASAIMHEEQERQHERVTANQSDPGLALLMARGLTPKQITAAEGRTESRIWQRISVLRHGHGEKIGQSFLWLVDPEAARQKRNRRKVCPRGHALTGDGVYITKVGKRRCRACAVIRQQLYRLRRKEAA